MLCCMHFLYYTLLDWNVVAMNYLSMDTLLLTYLQYFHQIKNTGVYVSNDDSGEKILDVEKLASSPEGCADFLKDWNIKWLLKSHEI